MSLDVQAIRSCFPSLNRPTDGTLPVFTTPGRRSFNGVGDRVLPTMNANHGVHQPLGRHVHATRSAAVLQPPAPKRSSSPNMTTQLRVSRAKHWRRAIVSPATTAPTMPARIADLTALVASKRLHARHGQPEAALTDLLRIAAVTPQRGGTINPVCRSRRCARDLGVRWMVERPHVPIEADIAAIAVLGLQVLRAASASCEAYDRLANVSGCRRMTAPFLETGHRQPRPSTACPPSIICAIGRIISRWRAALRCWRRDRHRADAGATDRRDAAGVTRGFADRARRPAGADRIALDGRARCGYWAIIASTWHATITLRIMEWGAARTDGPWGRITTHERSTGCWTACPLAGEAPARAGDNQARPGGGD